MNKIIKAKNDLIKKVKDNKNSILIGTAIGIPTAGCIIMGSELIGRDMLARSIWARLSTGEVYERVLENGSTFIMKVVEAGEEVCACESH